MDTVHHNKNSILSKIIGFLLAISLSISALAAIIWILGTNSNLMTSLFLRHAPTESTGLSETIYSDVAHMMTDFLAGAADTFQFTVDGVELFHEKEQLHMADCQALFRLDQTVFLTCLCISLILILLAGLLRNIRAVATGTLAGTVSILLLIAVIGGYGIGHFDQLFILFHRLSFSNDLWLLNPLEDLLIRLMPTSLFVHYAIIGVILWLTVMLVMGLVSWFIRKRMIRGNKDDL